MASSCGHDPSDTKPALLAAEGLGPQAGENIRVQEGSERRGLEDGCDPARHVEDQQPIPLKPGGGDMNIAMPLADFNGCVPAGTCGADQAALEKVVPSATARTTSVDPTI